MGWMRRNKLVANHQFFKLKILISVSGYQYQLLVNGMPAFSPHIVAERTETKKATNPELERALLQTAERAADAAIQLYLGHKQIQHTARHRHSRTD